jgi:hypothetical protein
LQLPAEQVVLSLHAGGVLQSICVPTHVPAALHASLSVQEFPSLQLNPKGFVGLEQTPLAVSQTPALWHWSDAVHAFGFEPTQAPDWQVSVCVQALPSSQATPSLATQTPVVVPQIMQPEHAAPVFCQVPVASQVWGCWPLHCLELGLHEPVQLPVALSQTLVHGVPVFCQVPVVSQA